MPQIMTETDWCRVFIGLGGNLGEPLAWFRHARQRLTEHPQIDLVASSPLYKTAPVGGPAGQPDYLNAVVELKTNLPPLALLSLCLAMEQDAGRKRTEHWGARTLDLDLLLYGQQIHSMTNLTLPHPCLHQRRFALQPLYDLAPEFNHPVFHQTVADLLQVLPVTTEAAADVALLQHNW